MEMAKEVSTETDEAFEIEQGLRALEMERRLARRRRFLQRVQQQGLGLVLIIVVGIMWVSSPYFMNKYNLLTAASVVSILGMMAVTETLLVISAEIDISIGGVMALVSVVTGLLVGHGLNIWLAAAVAMVVAGVVGAINGIITVYFKINSLVTTLGTFSIATGLAYVLSGTTTVQISGDGFGFLGSGYIFSVPSTVYFFVAIWLVGAYIARYTTLGRHIYATGDNIEAADRSGIRPNKIRMGLFISNSLVAGFTGLVVTSELVSSAPQIGDPYLLAVVTAVILGGASLTGGRGRLSGTLLAVAILGVVQNGFALLEFSSYLQNLVTGCLLIMAVLVDQFVRRAER
jgi:ribose/xylose/arabinose/galactoside ABC-type transport system permease subunit